MADQKIFVAGHRGMVGSAIVRALERSGRNTIIVRSREELNLTEQSSVREFFRETTPDQVYLAAAKVGGILANNTYRADFIYENLMIEANIIRSAFEVGVKKILFLGSSCIYPKLASQPIREESLMTGTLEPTNEPYAIAKIAGIALCDGYNQQYGESHGVDYRSVMPTNLYGPGDYYHATNSHVIPALIRRFHEAKESGLSSVEIWGTGTPRREFLYVDDMAAACVHLMGLDKATFEMHTRASRGVVNIGYGNDLTIAELAALIAATVSYQGSIEFDTSKPDGTPRKLLDSSLANRLGWSPHTDLEAGLALTYADFLGTASFRK
jgi:GDP-L-fucose synthase